MATWRSYAHHISSSRLSPIAYKGIQVLRFVAQGVSAGLAVAFVVALTLPEIVGLSKSPFYRQASEPQQKSSGVVSYANAVRLAAPAVVNVHTARVVHERTNPLVDDAFLRRFFERGANPREKRLETDLGSGVMLGPAGIVITNHHVIARADEIRVLLRDGRSATAEIVGTDPDTDLAVLRIDVTNPPMIQTGSVSALAVGDVVLAIGNPFGVGQTVTMGIVSAKGRSRLGINTFEDFIQTDAAINPGNSGGALITPAGALIGINTAIVSQSGGSEGIGFAIPVDVARHVMEQILAHGYVPRGWLGIEINPVTSRNLEFYGLKDAPSGVLVSGVLASGPGATAGLQPGDIISAVDGEPVMDPQDAVNAISSVTPGSTVELLVTRSGKRNAINAKVAQRPG